MTYIASGRMLNPTHSLTPERYTFWAFKGFAAPKVIKVIDFGTNLRAHMQLTVAMLVPSGRISGIYCKFSAQNKDPKLIIHVITLMATFKDLHIENSKN